MVVAGTDSGKPAPSTAFRAMFMLCSSTWRTHPAITSSTISGSIPDLSTSAERVCASRSVGCQSLSAFPRLATGVRTASTITGSLISAIGLSFVSGLSFAMWESEQRLYRPRLSFRCLSRTPGSQAGRQAAVHRDHGSGHVRCRPGCQVDRHASHVFLATDPAHRCPLSDLLSLGLEGCRHHA